MKVNFSVPEQEEEGGGCRGADGECQARHCLCQALSLNVGEGNGNPLQYSCLENSMDTGGWWVLLEGGGVGGKVLVHDFTEFTAQ